MKSNYMHIKLIAAAILCALSICSSAQSLNFGVTMGANFSYLVGRDKIDNSKPRTGVCPGLLLDIPLALDSYLEIGALYSQQGCVVKTDEYGKGSQRIKYTEHWDINYGLLPILWKQRCGDFYTEAGPYAAAAIQAKKTWKRETFDEFDNIDSQEGEEKSFVNNLRPYDVGGMFSVGYQTAISGSLDLFIGANYRLGFFSADSKESGSTVRTKVIKNQVFSVTAGLFMVHNRASKTYRHHHRH